MSETSSIALIFPDGLKNMFRTDTATQTPAVQKSAPVDPFDKTLAKVAATPDSGPPLPQVVPNINPGLTWQLVSSTTDTEQNQDWHQTAALPLTKGYRIYSEAANKGDSASH
ncbi:MAG: hypothetical protein HQL74_01765 [Magnetococcales bacterium]|nr:hypothetical protein [Magnetococcales bacterium]